MHKQESLIGITLWQAVFSTFGWGNPSLIAEDMVGLASFQFLGSTNLDFTSAD